MTEVFGVDSRLVFLAVVGLEAGERGVELWLSRRNSVRTFTRGGVESGRWAHRLVVVAHVAFLMAATLEVWFLERPFIPVLAATCGGLLAAAMALRYWAVTSLGDRWNLRVITVPGEAPVTAGPYRWVRHPNYLALLVELVALPMLHTAWLTVVVVAPLHAVVLWLKAGCEDRALGRLPVQGGGVGE